MAAWDRALLRNPSSIDRTISYTGWVQYPAILKMGSWLTLAFELCMGVLIWFRPFRYPLLLLGLLFHLCLEYALNLPMFEWDILAAYVLFVEPADLERVWRAIHQRWTRSRGVSKQRHNAAMFAASWFARLARRPLLRGSFASCEADHALPSILRSGARH